MNATTDGNFLRTGVFCGLMALGGVLVGGCAADVEVERLTGPGVTAVRDDLAAVNIGSADGVHIGQVYLVYRDDKYVGSLRIGTVVEHSAGGHLFAVRGRCSPGDRITELQPAASGRFVAGAPGGQVTRVSGDFVSISVGSEKGVKGGQVLLLYRGADFVANLRVVEVGAGFAAGEVYDKYREPTVGDRVTRIGR